MSLIQVYGLNHTRLNTKEKLQRIVDDYALFCSDKSIIKVFIFEIYNKKGDQVKQIMQAHELPIIFDEDYYYIDFKEIIIKYQIPKGYYLLLSLEQLQNDKENVIIYENEDITDHPPQYCPEVIKQNLEIRSNYLKKYKELELSLPRIQIYFGGATIDDIRKAIRYHEMRDWDGTVKFARKVLDCYRDNLQNVDVIPADRLQWIKQLAQKSFGFISNLGEHHGNKANISDANISKDLMISITIYISENIILKK